jgi:hypothetical protein
MKMPEYIEVNSQEVERHTYILSEQDKEAGEQEPRVKIDVDGEIVRSGKTKALIVIMPHYDNDKPTLINVGLNNKEISAAIDLAEAGFHDDTYKKEIERLENEVYRLEKELDRAREVNTYGW